MNQALFRTAAIAGALVFLAFAGHAAAGVPALSNSVTPLVIPVIDEQTAVEEFERPDLTPPPADGASSRVEQGEEDSGPGHEVRELQRAFPSTEWPPSMREKQ